MLATLGGIVSVSGVNDTHPIHEVLPSEINSVDSLATQQAFRVKFNKTWDPFFHSYMTNLW
jgi:hypothetical protein